MKTVDWSKVEHLCRLSFTGHRLSEQEQAVLQDAFDRFPEEYRTRTNAVRDGERAKLWVL